jgi:hypothetical protein
MTGAHTARVETAKIAPMITHDHQSLSGDAATWLVEGGLFVLAFTWRAFGMVNLSCDFRWRRAPVKA